MIYLDYTATTPVNLEVLDSINKTTKQFIGNANSLNKIGNDSLMLLNACKKQMSELLVCKEEEIYFTSGATQSNNAALIGVMLANHRRGKHLITSKLEHPSIYKICDYLKTVGFEITYVENDNNGIVDFLDLKKQIREDTILVSICGVNSEMGIRQPIKMIRQIIKKENSNTYFHSDMTQCLGKVNINLIDVDLASFSAHKIYGPKGIGLLYKNNYVKINPIIFGGGKLNELNPGTPPLPLITGFAKALRIAVENLDKKTEYINSLNNKITSFLKDYKNILINKTDYSIPHILNISTLGVRAQVLITALEKHRIYLSTNTACSSNEESSTVRAIYNDILRARNTVRISLSHLSTLSEINAFLEIFKLEYNNLIEIEK